MKTWEAMTHGVHPPYTPDLATFRFSPLWSAERYCPWKEDGVNDVVNAIRTWLHQQDKEWHQSGINAPVPSWQKTIELHAEFVENYYI